MARRKQARPRHIDLEEDDLATFLHSETSSGSPTDVGPGDAHVCGKCRGKFIELSDFLNHKKTCTRKRSVYIIGDETVDICPLNGMDSPVCRSGTSSVELMEEHDLIGKQTDDIISSANELCYEKMDSSDSDDLPSLVMSKGQFGVCADDLTGELDKSLDGVLNLSNNCKDTLNKNLNSYSTSLITSLPQSLLYSQYLPDTNVTLETLQNTKVAVAQHSSSNNNSQTTELAALQSALYTLQQQQIMQLQIIQQLQSQLTKLPPVSAPLPPLTGPSVVTSSQSGECASNSLITATTTTSILFKQSHSVHGTTPSSLETPKLNTGNSISDGTSQAIDSLQQPLVPSPPLPHEPNTLELLQRHTEQALQNTMLGGSFLLNGVISYSNEEELCKMRKGKLPHVTTVDGKPLPGQDDSFFRHRCRFCGKVFGSDSALQIHIRSHTGERPFRCNICGNRFSTKGNLKVHFQRHKSKYPNIEMDSNPFPEHLDKLYPPIEPPSGQQRMSPVLQEMSNSCNSQPPLLVPQIASLPQSQREVNGKHQQVPPSTDLQNRPTTSLEEELSNEEKSLSFHKIENPPNTTGEDSEEPELDIPLEKDDEVVQNGEDQEEIQQNRILSPEPSTSQSPIGAEEEKNDAEMKNHEELKSLPFHVGCTSVPLSVIPPYPPFLSTMAASYPTLFHPSFSPALPPFSLHSLTSTSSTHVLTPTATTLDDSNITHDPVFYQDLLPKPGSTDSNWESLMEVTKPSETTKLQQLVDNIEHKLSDPNQCVICHRVLSCRSALQMHYRTHTGERPFKCKICGRAFTTKGNLKTHMGVHRVKPPLRVLHQCPVCHKQFTNSLVLQQHIRMHTGEPTEMSPEQIMANEIKTSASFPAPFPRPILPLNFTNQNHLSHSVQTSFNLPHSHPSTPSNSPGTAVTSPSLQDLTKNTNSVIKTTSLPTNIQEDSKKELLEDDGSSQTEALPPQPVIDENVKVTSDIYSMTSTGAVTTTSISSPHSLLSLPLISDQPLSSSISLSSSSLAALENHTKSISTSMSQPLFAPFGMGIPLGYFPRFENPPVYLPRSQTSLETSTNNNPQVLASPYSPNSTTSKTTSDNSGDECSTPGSVRKLESPSIVSTPISSSIIVPSSVITSINQETEALDLTPKSSMLSSSTSPSPTEMVTQSFSSPLGGLPFASRLGRMNTTCQICLKTFACQSALLIHYRSHTKERPFKCDFCDRRFSTKGNMKQHMLTHKINDLPSQLFTTSPTLTTTTLNSSKSTNTTTVSNTTTASYEPKTSSHSHKRPVSENNAVAHPVPKRSPGMTKHMCHVCQKPFSSASAIQIHMRTHTGDKPFKCNVCERAFTTKGNLKVHMGTHMWNNSTSRRGRRMSIDLPALQMNPASKPGDFHPHRPDLYFPYLPPAYMNGMTTPKMNEISVIQSAGMTNGNIPSSLNMLSPQGLVRNIHQQPMTNAISASNITSPASTNGLKIVEEPEKKKSQSPKASRDLSSPGHPTIQHSPPAGDRPPTWGWKMACNICSKICASSTELENHIKSHFKSNNNEEDNSTSTSENLAA